MSKRGRDQRTLPPGELDERRLEQAARAARLQRQTECWSRIQEICREYKCSLVPQFVVTGTQIASQIVVVDAQ